MKENLPAEEVKSMATVAPPESDAASAIGAAIEFESSITGRIGRYRWVICALLFFATTINYVDRAVLGVLAPTLRTQIGWNDQHYGYINSAFTLAYAIGYLFAGWLIDRIGTRLGFAFSLIVWSL